MFKAVWFLAKIAVLVCALGWLAARPGWMTIDWLGYRTEIAVGFCLAALLTLMLGVIFIDRIWRAFVSVPGALRRYRFIVRREKGYKALTQGLVAVAAGDARSAEKSARSAEALIPGTPLTKLLTAQTALLNGNVPKARREFTALLEDGDAAFFGLRGLLNETLKEGNYAEALTLIRKADALQPKRHWVVRTRFELETRNRAWAESDMVLKRAEKLAIYDKNAARHHRQAIYTAQAADNRRQGYLPLAARQAARAAALDFTFSPASLLLAQTYEQLGKRRTAVRAIEKAWRAAPHPELAALWMGFAPPPKKEASVYEGGREAYIWAKRLFDLNPQHRDSQRLLGTAALDAKLWKEARERLAQAADYRALAKLERQETGNEAKAREWLELAAEYPPEPKWVCNTCGHIAPSWTVLCSHCSAFDTQAWMTPQTDTYTPPQTIGARTDSPDLIAPPTAQMATGR